MAPLTTVDSCGRTALHYCATNRQSTIVNLLLEHWLQTGSDARSLLEMSDCDGLTALAHAVVDGNYTIVEQLLMMGADVSCHDNQRRTVMHLATGHNLRLSMGMSVRLYYIYPLLAKLQCDSLSSAVHCCRHTKQPTSVVLKLQKNLKLETAVSTAILARRHVHPDKLTK